MELIREKKSAFNALYFFVIFVACYLPHFCSAALLTLDSDQISFWLAYYVTVFFVLLNSSLNPAVYCWRYREIRQIMKGTVKENIPLHRDLRWNKDVRVIDLSFGYM